MMASTPPRSSQSQGGGYYVDTAHEANVKRLQEYFATRGADAKKGYKEAFPSTSVPSPTPMSPTPESGSQSQSQFPVARRQAEPAPSILAPSPLSIPQNIFVTPFPDTVRRPRVFSATPRKLVHKKLYYRTDVSPTPGELERPEKPERWNELEEKYIDSKDEGKEEVGDGPGTVRRLDFGEPVAYDWSGRIRDAGCPIPEPDKRGSASTE